MATSTRTAPAPAAKPVPAPVEPVPPLENGDHLTRAEFERRYDAMPGLKKAELIEGVVHMPSPVAHRRHGSLHPDLIVEVASSSASFDLHEKLRVYRRNGVRVYVVWRTRDEAIDWFVLRDTEYERLAPDADGLLRCEAFPGLWLDPAALVVGDMARVLAVVQQGLATPEHAAFVEQLRAEAARRAEAQPPPQQQPQQPQGDRP